MSPSAQLGAQHLASSALPNILPYLVQVKQTGSLKGTAIGKAGICLLLSLIAQIRAAELALCSTTLCNEITDCA